jgi:hypothetical protein
MTRWLLSSMILTMFIGVLCAHAVAAPPDSEEFFEKKIRPLLVEKCYKCHSAGALSRDNLKGGLQLDTRSGLRAGGESGPAVVPGKPTQGTLLSALRYEDHEMPPDAPLSTEQITIIEQWIRHGAVDPREGKPTAVAKPIDFEAGRKHWAYQPIRMPQTPKVKNQRWSAEPIDRFVLARLEAHGIAPSAPADRRTWIRRVTFDLVGLPPTFEQVAAFLEDASSKAKQRVVDRLLASPEYGQRWARHWLDVARYADTRGYVGVGHETRYPFAYTYRDYVVQSLNDDKPFDRFVLEQLAADQLELSEDKSELAAMGFLTAGHNFMGRKHLAIDQTIDVISRGLFGLTVTCARCHDHKFDAIAADDYYSLYSIIANGYEPGRLPTIGKLEKTPEFLAYAKQRDALQAAIEEFDKREKKPGTKLNTKQRNERKKLTDRLIKHEFDAPGAPKRAMVLFDKPQPTGQRIHIRGNPTQHGKPVARRYLRVLSNQPEHEQFTTGSGRLELARAIAATDNPLTARVIVNRIWQHHFGHGLVRTPSDFGTRGDRPTHPKLLDHLAATFMADGWSLKRLHRRIVLSQAYAQSSNVRSAPLAKDPENRLIWRYARRRLDFEAMRDSLLAVSGQLDCSPGGRGVDIFSHPASKRRSLYAEVRREEIPTLHRAFDVANPNISTATRTNTTVPQQALFLMNSPFVLAQANHLAARAAVRSESENNQAWVRALYRLALSREPDAQELGLSLAFLKTEPLAATTSEVSPREKLAQTLLQTNEFMFVD